MDLYTRLDAFCENNTNTTDIGRQCMLWKDSRPFCSNEELNRVFTPAQAKSFINDDGTVDEFVAKNGITLSTTAQLACGVRMQNAKNLAPSVTTSSDNMLQPSRLSTTTSL